MFRSINRKQRKQFLPAICKRIFWLLRLLCALRAWFRALAWCGHCRLRWENRPPPSRRLSPDSLHVWKRKKTSFNNNWLLLYILARMTKCKCTLTKWVLFFKLFFLDLVLLFELVVQSAVVERFRRGFCGDTTMGRKQNAWRNNSEETTRRSMEK